MLACRTEDVKLEPLSVDSALAGTDPDPDPSPTPLRSSVLAPWTVMLGVGGKLDEGKHRADPLSHLTEGAMRSTLRTCLARMFCLVALRMEECVSSRSFPLLLCIDEARLDPKERSRWSDSPQGRV